jgi:response regulator RpfG family c-di-GMP phosphodiesterase
MQTPSTRKILVVDDDQKLLFILATHLRAAGFEVVLARDGAEAIDQARNQLPDLIVMDITMPGLDGIEATRRLRTDERTEHIPIIILTAKSSTNDLVLALDAGAQEYLTKPFDMTELLARVRTVYRLVMARKELDALNDRLEHEVKIKTRRLEALNDFMQDLNRAQTRERILDLLVHAIRDVSGAGRVSVMMLDATEENLVCERAFGIDAAVVKAMKVGALEGVAGQVFRSGKTLSAQTFGDERDAGRHYERSAFVSAPLVTSSPEAPRSMFGVINVTDKQDESPFSEDEVDCIRSISDAAAIALQGVLQKNQLRESLVVLLKTIGHLAEYRDEETTLHIERVGLMTRILAMQLSRRGPLQSEVTDEFVEMIEQAAPLHDIGKVGIPDEILTKPGRLTDEEFQIMKTHTDIGRRVLSLPMDGNKPVPLLSMCIDIAHGHHEKYDGKGYPRRLAGRQIPLSARIVALVDAYDAITSRRRYKKERSHEEAVRVIRSERGRHFDPDVVDAFLECHDQFDELRARCGDSAESIGVAQV